MSKKYKSYILDCDELTYPIGINIIENLKTIKLMAEAIMEMFPENEIILWGRGSSGGVISGVISTFLVDRNVTINHVKKEGEKSHSKCWYLKTPTANHIIIDDFIRSGETLREIAKEMEILDIKINGICITGSIYTPFIEEFNPDVVIASYIH